MLLAPPDEDGDAASAHRVRWEDVGGLEATKQLLTEAAVLPMRIQPYPYPDPDPYPYALTLSPKPNPDPNPTPKP